MKKLLIALSVFLPIAAMGQNSLDTIRVRHLTLQAQDWAWLVGRNQGNINRDSSSIKAHRKIREAVQTVQNPQWTTSITIDSIPGRIVMEFYDAIKLCAAGQIAARYNTILSAISSKTVLAYWIGRSDESFARDYDDTRNKGKNILLDQ